MYHTTTVVGHLGRDPETRTIPSGATVTTFSMATTRKYTRSDGTEAKETTWYTIEAWGKLGDVCKQYLKKGSKALAVGRLVPDPKTGGPRVYQKQDGSWGASFILRADTVRFLDSKGEGRGQGGEEYISSEEYGGYEEGMEQEVAPLGSGEIPF